jgi:SAM-dependent methyltransferase
MKGYQFINLDGGGKMEKPTDDKIRQAVRKTYGNIAKNGSVGCGCGCGQGSNSSAEDIAVGLGYSGEDAAATPEGSNMGLGCGNPQAVASLRAGETVVDLGSGGGFDCFLAARVVGENGHVIGVDMTPEMISKARENAEKTGLTNVEFRLGEIENLPVADQSVDVIISNCVVNLSPEKANVFNDAFRVLKRGGRLAIADIVATAPLPENIRHDLALHAGCVSGAAQVEELRAMLEEAGFVDVRIGPIDKSKEIVCNAAPGSNVEDFIISASIEATKP